MSKSLEGIVLKHSLPGRHRYRNPITKGILLGLTLVLIALPGLAAVTLGAPLTTAFYLPEGSDESTARYTFAYNLPQVADEGNVGLGINTYYQILAEELAFFTAPIQQEVSEDITSDTPMYTRFDYQVTANTDDYFSVLITTDQMMGAASAQLIRGHVFALHGDGAGQVVTMPDMLGFDDDASATRAVDTVYDLVWAVIADQLEGGDYFEDITQEDLFAEFYPEEDFYLDESGNLVFFIQPGLLSSEAVGVLRFPFAPEEILTAME